MRNRWCIPAGREVHRLEHWKDQAAEIEPIHLELHHFLLILTN